MICLYYKCFHIGARLKDLSLMSMKNFITKKINALHEDNIEQEKFLL